MTASQKAEALGETIEFKYEGDTYSVDAEAMNDLNVLELIEDEKYLSVTRTLIGEEGYQAFKAANTNEAGRVPLDSFEGFLKTLFEVLEAKN